MKELRVIASRNILGTVVSNSGVEYLLPANYGRYSYDELERLDEIEYREATFEEKIEYIRRDFTWGRIIDIHTVGDYQIIEYIPKRNKEERCFHPYIGFNDTNTSYETLDKALTGVIFEKYEGHMNQLNYYVWKIMDK